MMEKIMKVKEVMHDGVTWVNPNTPILEIANMMQTNDVGSIPVGENDRLIGMVTDRDIVCRGVASGKDIATLTARDVMTRGIVYCQTEDDVGRAIDTMKNKKIRRLTVLDANKRMVGMLSLGDLFDKAGPTQFADVMRAVSSHHA
jgi:CBS domain-containing protein